ncbi:hypothetical protein EV44_g5127 [Erysiphe necator]|uniref:Uncharacterized protein n=1 Tax=Uncinula necator TaxID=52586 RepID=A0A0B1NZI1_UNCNE|nr:hypothetical protein EV44_g5127 [Erysiphe necator]
MLCKLQTSFFELETNNTATCHVVNTPLMTVADNKIKDPFYCWVSLAGDICLADKEALLRHGIVFVHRLVKGRITEAVLVV